MNELAQSIKTNGVIQPIEVSLNGDGRYLIHHGERRWRAAIMAGLDSIPVIIVEPLSEEARFVRAVIENEQREDMAPMDKARAYRRLMEEFGYSKVRVAREVGRSLPHVDNLLRWLETPPAIQAMVGEKRLPTDGRVATALLSLPPEAQVMMADRLTKGGRPSIKTAIKACEKFTAVASPPAKPQAAPPTRNKREVFPPALTLLAHQPADGEGIAWLTIKQAAQQQCSNCPAWMPGDDTLVCKQCPLAQAVRMIAEGVGG